MDFGWFAGAVAGGGLFTRGLMIGLAIAAPVGPIGLLCIRRSLAGGFRLGFLTGLGAAAADGFYGAVAAFGLSSVSGFLVAQQRWLALLGGLALIYLGVQTARRRAAEDRPNETAAEASARSTQGNKDESLVGAFASTCLLTLANPATILSFIAVFAGLGLASVGTAPGGGTLGAGTLGGPTPGDGTLASETAGAMHPMLGAATIVAGVFLGSAAWWLFLAGVTAALRRQVPPGALVWINQLSGTILIGFGLLALASLL